MIIESESSVPTLELGECELGRCSEALASDAWPEPYEGWDDECTDENWSTQLVDEAASSEGGALSSCPENDITETEPLSERASASDECCSDSKREGKFDSDGAVGIWRSAAEAAFDALDCDCSACVILSTSMPSMICAPSVGRRAMIVNDTSCWFCSNLRRRLCFAATHKTYERAHE